jgi:excinuclease ABC subunit C
VSGGGCGRPVRAPASTAVGRLPSEPGVYRFRDRHGTVLYLGRAADLRSRVRSYWSDLRDRRHLVPMVRSVEQIEAVVCASRHEAAWLERSLLEAELPPWNRTPGGQEVVVYLRLDAREATPGLSVEHETQAPVAGVRWSGPYLGGAQVRRAAAALRRVFPIQYAAGGAAGTHRSLARRLGVDATDRDGLAAAITAILDRRPEAVASLLDRLTDERAQASAARDYERAERTQRELHALEWVTSPQRLARRDGRDCDVHGWAAGVLFGLTIRGGRPIAWTQQLAEPAAAQRRLATTPADLRAFASDNAQLAGRLCAG